VKNGNRPSDRSVLVFIFGGTEGWSSETVCGIGVESVCLLCCVRVCVGISDCVLCCVRVCVGVLATVCCVV
jgi:hypothetical protein